MSWDDDAFGVEYFKFKSSNPDVDLLYDYAYMEYLEIDWDTIREEKNLWDKKRMRVDVNHILPCMYTPHRKDEIEKNDNLVLDMGSRLFNEIRQFAKDKPKYVSIIKTWNPRDKFDTNYHVAPYKLHIKGAIKTKEKKK